MTAPALSSPVVSTQWLADALGDDQLVVLDATVLPYVQPNGRGGYLSGHEQYLIEGHLPGAFFADLTEVFSDPDSPLRFTRPDAAAFEDAARSVGVSNDSTVIVYDAVVGQWASRIWWLFRSFGYDRVAVLDGGLKKWRAEGREIDTGHIEPRPGSFVAEPRPELWVTKADVEAIVDGSAPGALVCGVPPKEFSGEEGSRARLGHIPGSISAPAARLVSRDTNALLSEDELRQTFAPVLDQERIVAYCAAGIAATSDALALTLLGHRNVAVYDGSLNEWVADDRLPIVSGA